MPETVSIGPFPLGMNNIAKETALPQGSLREANNIDIGVSGNAKTRGGYIELYSGIDIHSLYKRYFAEGTDLKYLNPDNTATILRSDLPSGTLLNYCELNGQILYTDGEGVYNVNGTSLGLEDVPGQPTLTSGTGFLLAGSYQVAVNFIDPVSGEISGATNSVVITVADSSSIVLSDIPQPIGDYLINIYVSGPNASLLFHNTTLTKGTTTAIIQRFRSDTQDLQTLNMRKLPGGHILRSFNSRLLVAKDNAVYFTDSFRPGLYRPEQNFYLFPERITILQPVDSGIFIVADKTYFIAGKSPEDANQSIKSETTGIEGTGITIDAAQLGLEYSGNIAYWFSDKGATYGLPNGDIEEISRDKLAVPQGLNIGSSLFQEKDGIKKIVTSMLSNDDTRVAAGASDNASAYIIRNGEIIT